VKNLTLIIPAKHEADSLPKVINEINNLNCKILVVLEKTDIETINSIKNFDIKVIHQTGKGYGNAIIEGIKNTNTEYMCIFNADGSFDPKYLNEMLINCKRGYDLVFASRYMKNAGSDDDTFLTAVGNFIFTLVGNILFSLNLSDILFTFILGKTEVFKDLNLESNRFTLCVEIPIKARKKKINYIDIPSYERKRIAGYKKVNEFRDGFEILFYMLKTFFKIIK
tara:strand:- start:339 stop:1010 length:672 start_codon:yes stop_codon:yes gene_type:complete